MHQKRRKRKQTIKSDKYTKFLKRITGNHMKRNRSRQMKEGLADMAQRAEMDHEVQMARSDLYKIAKYAVKLHDMLKSVSEAEGLQGWQQAKITKASDYISSVYHNLDYKMKFDGAEMDLGEEDAESKKTESKDAYKSLLHRRLSEKAVSKSQQQAAGAALAAKRGDAPKSKLKGASKEMMNMSTKELEKYAGTKHKGLPKKKD